MMKNVSGTIIILSLLAGMAYGTVDTAASSLENIPTHYPRTIRSFASTFPDQHLSKTELSDAVSQRAWTNFLNALDYDHIFLTQQDVDQFRKWDTKLDDILRDGQIDFAVGVYTTLISRVEERVAHIDTLLEKGFDLTIDETYQWKRRKEPWPADTAEQNELWRKKIKNEYIQRLLSDEFAKEEADAQSKENETDATPEEEKKEPVDNSEEVLEIPKLSPEEFIRKRYNQFASTLRDNDSEWVLQLFLSSVAHAYDPHSAYMSPASTEDFDIGMRLSLVGIGALLRADDGAAKIVQIIPGGPADKDTSENHLRPGDKIIGVGQGKKPIVDTLHWPLYKVVRQIRGKKGTSVVLLVIPASDPTGSQTKLVKLVRDEVKLEEQAAKSELRELTLPDGTIRKLGVIDVPAFYANMKASWLPIGGDVRRVSSDVQNIITELREKEVEGIILDLRGNGGGSLLESIRMTGLFISAGPVVQVREPNNLRILPDMDARVAYTGPLVVLVDRLSASASEILAAALQDYRRAIIVGDSKTHGKGTVQTIAPLGDEKQLGSIKVTCSVFYRINGKSTQKMGVTPDIIIPSAFDSLEIGEDTLPNAMDWTLIRPAFYQPVNSVKEWRNALSDASDKRREKDARFTAQKQLLDRIREMNETKIVPLQIAKRRDLARAERELRDLQEEAISTPDGKDNEEKNDLVLDETLNILADMVTLSKKTKATEANKAAEADSMGQLENGFIKWLRGQP